MCHRKGRKGIWPVKTEWWDAGMVIVSRSRCRFAYVVCTNIVQTIGRLRVHGDVTSLGVCHDGRTLVLGCADGSVQSYVLVDVECDQDWTHLLSSLPSRNPSSCRTSSTSGGKRSSVSSVPAARVWDKVVTFSLTHSVHHRRMGVYGCCISHCLSNEISRTSTHHSLVTAQPMLMKLETYTYC